MGRTLEESNRWSPIVLANRTMVNSTNQSFFIQSENTNGTCGKFGCPIRYRQTITARPDLRDVCTTPENSVMRSLWITFIHSSSCKDSGKFHAESHNFIIFNGTPNVKRFLSWRVSSRSACFVSKIWFTSDIRIVWFRAVLLCARTVYATYDDLACQCKVFYMRGTGTHVPLIEVRCVSRYLIIKIFLRPGKKGLKFGQNSRDIYGTARRRRRNK